MAKTSKPVVKFDPKEAMKRAKKERTLDFAISSVAFVGGALSLKLILNRFC